MEWREKNVAVLGFGREGVAAATYLLAKGARVTVCDQRSAAELSQESYRTLESMVSWRLGSTYLDGLADFDIMMRSPGVRLWPKISQAVAAGVELTSPTQEFFQVCPARIVGVTGTKGKGTTVSLLTAMLRGAGVTVHVVGNIGTPAIGQLSEIQIDDIVVYELSSFQLLDVTVSPHVAVVLGVTVEHQDYHDSVADYVRAKANIVRFQKETDVAIVAVDYPTTEGIAVEALGRLLPVSTRRTLEYGVWLDGERVVAELGNGIVPIIPITDVRLPGRFNLENVVAAVAASLVLDVPIEAIATALKTFTGLPHRLQYVADRNGVAYWNNSYATTPEATIAAVESFTAPIILLLGGKEKGFAYEAFGQAVARSSVKTVVAIGENASALYAAIQRAAQEQGKTPIELLDGGETMAAMVAVTQQHAMPGDIVLLSPAAASFDKFVNATDRGEQFCAAVQALT